MPNRSETHWRGGSTVLRQDPTETTCPSCGVIAAHRQEDGQWGPHRRRLICPDCGGFIRWLPTTAPEVREVRRREGIREWMSAQPPSDAQLAKLRALSYQGPQPMSKLAACDLIDAMLREGRS